MDLLMRLAIIGCGGFCGAVLRYLVSGWIQQRSSLLFFPLGTMGVNLLGCFFIGLLTMLVESRSMFSVELRSFLLIGLLGSFTTFSTFGNETLMLIREGRLDLAAVNGSVQVVVGLGMVWCGRIVAAGIWR
ncbi:fluoride efflux transporter CrcB [Desulfogranum mediterraneum]|uniref:fluoride efflux transporter CrcB n=1 Tax=Desulfogranum mediterraneum TaxID=160661 RepID=UPI0004178428|nr:fluoride efflux transporter CrcB [Desulfogranum mediterraneum]